MPEHPDRLAVVRLDHHRDVPVGRLVHRGGEIVSEHLLVAHARYGVPLHALGVELGHQRHVRLGRRPEAIALALTGGKPVHVARVPPAPALPGQRELVAELPVVPGYAGDAEHRLAPVGAPPVQKLHLGPRQPSPAIRTVGDHGVDAADRELDSLVRPRLRDQIERGDDLAGARILDYGEVSGREARQVAGHQVPCPGHDGAAGFGHVAAPVRDQHCDRLGVVHRRPSEDEAVAQVGTVPGVAPAVVGRHSSPQMREARLGKSTLRSDRERSELTMQSGNAYSRSSAERKPNSS